jgi:glutaconate CoA-transferase, subunit A
MTDHNLGSKLMTAEEAVSKFIKNGDQLALGGFTVNRNPMLLAREIIKQRIEDLHVVCHSHGQALDLLVGAGCVSYLEIAYGGMGRFAPTCIRFRKAVCSGLIKIDDYSNYQMSLRFLGGAMGLPFMVTKSGLETDLVKIDGFSKDDRGKRKIAKKKLEIARNPFGGANDTVVLLPSLNPDVSIIHAQYVGEDGTVRIRGLTFADLEQAKSASRVIVTCEEILSRSEIRKDPDQNSLPPFLIDAVVKAPIAAHPTACHHFYDYDPTHLRMYADMARDDGKFQRYLKEWVYDIPDQVTYIEKVGLRRLAEIKADPSLGYAPGLNRK